MGGVEVFEDGLGVLAARTEEVADLGEANGAVGLDVLADALDEVGVHARLEDHTRARVLDEPLSSQVGKQVGGREGFGGGAGTAGPDGSDEGVSLLLLGVAEGDGVAGRVEPAAGALDEVAGGDALGGDEVEELRLEGKPAAQVLARGGGAEGVFGEVIVAAAK